MNTLTSHLSARSRLIMGACGALAVIAIAAVQLAPSGRALERAPEPSPLGAGPTAALDRLDGEPRGDGLGNDEREWLAHGPGPDPDRAVRVGESGGIEFYIGPERGAPARLCLVGIRHGDDPGYVSGCGERTSIGSGLVAIEVQRSAGLATETDRVRFGLVPDGYDGVRIAGDADSAVPVTENTYMIDIPAGSDPATLEFTPDEGEPVPVDRTLR